MAVKFNLGMFLRGKFFRGSFLCLLAILGFVGTVVRVPYEWVSLLCDKVCIISAVAFVMQMFQWNFLRINGRDSVMEPVGAFSDMGIADESNSELQVGESYVNAIVEFAQKLKIPNMQIYFNGSYYVIGAFIEDKGMVDLCEFFNVDPHVEEGSSQYMQTLALQKENLEESWKSYQQTGQVVMRKFLDEDDMADMKTEQKKQIKREIASRKEKGEDYKDLKEELKRL